MTMQKGDLFLHPVRRDASGRLRQCRVTKAWKTGIFYVYCADAYGNPISAKQKQNYMASSYLEYMAAINQGVVAAMREGGAE